MAYDSPQMEDNGTPFMTPTATPGLRRRTMSGPNMRKMYLDTISDTPQVGVRSGADVSPTFKRRQEERDILHRENYNLKLQVHHLEQSLARLRDPDMFDASEEALQAQVFELEQQLRERMGELELKGEALADKDRSIRMAMEAVSKMRDDLQQAVAERDQLRQQLRGRTDTQTAQQAKGDAGRDKDQQSALQHSQDTQQEISRMQEEAQRASGKIQELQQEASQLRETVQEQSQEILRLRGEAQQASDEMQRMQQESSKLQDKARDEAQKQSGEMQEEISQLRVQAQLWSQELQDVHRRALQLQEEAQRKSQEFLEQSQEMSRLQEEAQQKSQETSQQSQEISRLQNEAQHKSQEISQLQQEAQHKSEEISQQSREMLRLQEEAQRVSIETQVMQQEVQPTDSQLQEEAQRQTQELEQKISRLEEEARRASREVQGLRRRQEERERAASRWAAVHAEQQAELLKAQEALAGERRAAEAEAGGAVNYTRQVERRALEERIRQLEEMAEAKAKATVGRTRASTAAGPTQAEADALKASLEASDREVARLHAALQDEQDRRQQEQQLEEERRGDMQKRLDMATNDLLVAKDQARRAESEVALAGMLGNTTDGREALELALTEKERMAGEVRRLRARLAIADKEHDVESMETSFAEDSLRAQLEVLRAQLRATELKLEEANRPQVRYEALRVELGVVQGEFEELRVEKLALKESKKELQAEFDTLQREHRQLLEQSIPSMQEAARLQELMRAEEDRHQAEVQELKNSLAAREAACSLMAGRQRGPGDAAALERAVAKRRQAEDARDKMEAEVASVKAAWAQARQDIQDLHDQATARVRGLSDQLTSKEDQLRRAAQQGSAREASNKEFQSGVHSCLFLGEVALRSNGQPSERGRRLVRACKKRLLAGISRTDEHSGHLLGRLLGVVDEAALAMVQGAGTTGRDMRGQLDAVNDAVEKMELYRAEVERQGSDIQELEKELEQATADCRNRSGNCAAEEECKKLSSLNADLEEEVKRLRSEVRELRAADETWEAGVRPLQEEATAAKEAVRAFEARAQQLESDLKVAEARAKAAEDRARRSLRAARRRAQEAERKSLSEIEAAAEKADRELKQMQGELELQQDSVRTCQEKHADLEERCKKAEDKARGLQEMLDAMHETVRTRQQTAARAGAEMDSFQQRLSAVTSERDGLRSQVEELQEASRSGMTHAHLLTEVEELRASRQAEDERRARQDAVLKQLHEDANEHEAARRELLAQLEWNANTFRNANTDLTLELARSGQALAGKTREWAAERAELRAQIERLQAEDQAAELLQVRAQVVRLQGDANGARESARLARARIATMEHTIEQLQAVDQTAMLQQMRAQVVRLQGDANGARESATMARATIATMEHTERDLREQLERTAAALGASEDNEASLLREMRTRQEEIERLRATRQRGGGTNPRDEQLQEGHQSTSESPAGPRGHPRGQRSGGGASQRSRGEGADQIVSYREREGLLRDIGQRLEHLDTLVDPLSRLVADADRSFERVEQLFTDRNYRGPPIGEERANLQRLLHSNATLARYMKQVHRDLKSMYKRFKKVEQGWEQERARAMALRARTAQSLGQSRQRVQAMSIDVGELRGGQDPAVLPLTASRPSVLGGPAAVDGMRTSTNSSPSSTTSPEMKTERSLRCTHGVGGV